MQALDIFEILKCISDIGLFVLIWIVQLVIYPSFKYYEASDLIIWHNEYTKRISIVVMPLMLIQIFQTVYFMIINYSDGMQTFYTVLVLLTWITTFMIFVPLHALISKGEHKSESLDKLVNYNWVRTLLWTLILFLNFYS